MAARVNLGDIVKQEAESLLQEISADLRPRAERSLRRVAYYWQEAAATGNQANARRYIGWEISTLASLAGLTAVATAERVRAILSKAADIFITLLAGALAAA